jgi:selenocysteine lyase/cysteine desulfurase
MEFSRRSWLGGMAITPIVGLAGTARAAEAEILSAPAPIAPITKADFNLGGRTYLNNAGSHPLSNNAAAAMRAYIDGKTGGPRTRNPHGDPRAQFARIINAKPSEIAVIQATNVGENWVAIGLGLRGSKARVVTDGGHFMGSLYMYDELAKQGLDVQRVKVRPDGTVSLDDIAARMNKNTRLVAVSLVSMTTGFKYDLKALCDLAHSYGAWVHVDAIQAVGSSHVDVRDSGVDSLAAGTYKWLMGEGGVGFFYVREDRFERLGHPVYGYAQVDFSMSKMPYDPIEPGGGMTPRQDARGHFEIGGEAGIAMEAAQDSMARLLMMGLDPIVAHRKPLLAYLRETLPSYGYKPLAANSDASLACFAFKDADQRLSAKLRDAGITIAVYENRIRVAPSIYNDMDDMRKLADVLKV